MLEQVVRSRVDVDHVAGTEAIGGQQRRQAGHRRARALTAVGVVAHGGGEDVAGLRVVVDVIVVAGIGQEERLIGHARGLDAIVGGRADQVGVARWQVAGNRPQVASASVAVDAQVGGDRRPVCPVSGDLEIEGGWATPVGLSARTSMPEMTAPTLKVPAKSTRFSVMPEPADAVTVKFFSVALSTAPASATMS